MFKAVFTETLDEIRQGVMSKDSLFDAMAGENSTSTIAIRWLAWFLNVFGHYLLWSPVIALFKWIPFVGWLFAYVISLVACIFSCVWGTMIHLMVMTVAWIVYRPLFGLLLLCGVAACVGVMFFVKPKEGDVPADEAAAAPVTK